MPFLNRYDKEKQYYYSNSKKIGKHIYSIGKYKEIKSEVALITKIDLNGEVVWEKTYNENTTYIEIIECTNGDLLILGQYSTSSKIFLYLSRINSNNGSLLWQKILDKYDQNYYGGGRQASSIINIGNEKYILATKFNLNPSHSGILVIKFDYYGNIINKKIVCSELGSLFFKCVVNAETKFSLFGDASISTTTDNFNKSLIIELDYDLNYVIDTIASDVTGISNCFYKDNFLYVFNFATSLYNSTPSLFLSKLLKNPTNHTIESINSKKLILDNTNLFIWHNENNIFLEDFTNQESVISTIDYTFTPLQTKRYEYFSNRYFSGCITNVTNNNILILDATSYSANLFTDYLIGCFNPSLDSCRTKNESLISIQDGLLNYYLADLNITLVDVDIIFNDLGVIFTIQDVNSIKVEICPTVIDSEPPCSIDEDLCKLYEQILEIYKDCLINIQAIKDPKELNNISSSIDQYKKCFEKILSIINNANVAFSYNILGIIQSFMANPTIENYILAYNAVKDLLEYLLVTGNCDCTSSTNCNIELCQELIKIIGEHLNCVKNPNQVNNSNLYDVRNCLKKFLYSLQVLIANFPQYQLSTVLANQITAIESFLNNSTTSNYPYAWTSFNYILAYINQLGNCDILGDNSVIPNPPHTSYDESLCNQLADTIQNTIGCVTHPQVTTQSDLNNIKLCLESFLASIETTILAFPQYSLQTIIQNQLNSIQNFIDSINLGNYSIAWNSYNYILNALNQIGSCDYLDGGLNPSNNDGPTTYNQALCSFLNALITNYINCVKNPESVNTTDLSIIQSCLQSFLQQIDQLYIDFPIHQFSTLFENQISDIKSFTINPVITNYTPAWNGFNYILSYINQIGSCDLLTNSSGTTTNTNSPNNNINIPVTINTNAYNGVLMLQSPYLYLQAAGSLGQDSSKGIHLRWTFGGYLGDNHLPKSNYASQMVNFNRPNDVVKIYRTPYVPAIFTLSFSTAPNVVDDTNCTWVYKFNNNQRLIFVKFHNATKYASVRATTNPLTQSQLFIKNYGNEVVEVENKTELFFAAAIKVEDIVSNSVLQSEGLVVPENTLTAPKGLSYRKTLSSTNIANTKFYIENGRSIRFKAKDCLVTKIHFEFYSDFIENKNQSHSWFLFGQYALTKNSLVAFNQLEPHTGLVHGKWLRYNDNAYVNKDNYQDRWTHAPAYSGDRNMYEIISNYIALSDDASNPQAIESIVINLANTGNDVITTSTDPEDQTAMEISNLDVLRMASFDYHIARMLGLGVLDWQNEATSGNSYIYLAEYFTFGDLHDGQGIRSVHHLSMSLPTSNSDQRLCLPIDLKEIKPGVYNNDGSQGSLTDAEGYFPDGRTRYVSLYSDSLLEAEIDKPFYFTSSECDYSKETSPVFAGLEHRNVQSTDTGVWDKPELAHDPEYMNIDDDSTNCYETVHLGIPENNEALYIHRQQASGTHHYEAYGINWFSRATASNIELDIVTQLKPANCLKPPINVNPFLIRREYPLLFTSQEEQSRYANNTNTDKTLVRLTFDYNAYQELFSYKIPLEPLSDFEYLNNPDSLFPDSEEVFAEDIEIYFRQPVPKSIAGKAVAFTPETNDLLYRIHTANYNASSTGEVWIPQLPLGTTHESFEGSIFLMGSQQYKIHHLEDTPSGTLDFIVYKNEISDSLNNGSSATTTTTTLQIPTLEGDGLFTVVENMQNEFNWGTTTNPQNPIVKVGDNRTDFKTVHRELIYQQLSDASFKADSLEKTRGFWFDATIETVLENFVSNDGTQITNQPRGLYKITFTNFSLSEFSTCHNNNSISVEWFNGVVRLFTQNSIINNDFTKPISERKAFKVVRLENVGTSNPLIVYLLDPEYELLDNGTLNPNYNSIITGAGLKVNFYPGYKVYLYADAARNLTEQIILPAEGEGERLSIFGLRSIDYNYQTTPGAYYKSPFSVPALMYAQEIITAEQPEQPEGALYATRPDFYGKSTYTFTTQFTHKPYGVLFYRSENELMLNAIYTRETVNTIKESLNNLGGFSEPYFGNRWTNFVDFDLLCLDKIDFEILYPPQDSEDNSGKYNLYPPAEVSQNNYQFPLPNNSNLFEGINQFIVNHNAHFGTNIDQIASTDFGNIALNTIIIPEIVGQSSALKFADFVKEAIMQTFVPLTEVPVLYQYIKDNNYKPIPKKQTVRGTDGLLLNPSDPKFDMAPMMKISGTNKVQFTDFTLEGTSNNIYYYASKEMSSQMKLGSFSALLGPIKLVNSNPPEAPAIKRVIPILENRILGINPAMQIEINSYSKLQNIKKINIYRCFDRLDAESIRSMKLIKVVDLDIENLTGEDSWTFFDSFEDLAQVPFGDPLFYRITVSRKVEYAEANYDTSNPATVVIEYAPSTPSKIVGTIMPENVSPETPVLNYTAAPFDPEIDGQMETITFSWEPTVYKGNYSIHKMNSQGNWVEIIRLKANRDNAQEYFIYNIDNLGNWVNTIHTQPIALLNGKIYLPIEYTNLAINSLAIQNTSQETIYHHFKIVVQNTSGMFSLQEKILTMYDINSYHSDEGISEDGIGGMIIQGNFIVKNN